MQIIPKKIKKMVPQFFHCDAGQTLAEGRGAA
jgi:hypothetical protein